MIFSKARQTITPFCEKNTTMRLTAVSLTILFFIWILPLGVFIKPFQEKLACDGQRAICMCSHLMAKQAVQNDGKAFSKVGGGAQSEKDNSFSSGMCFFFRDNKNLISNQISSYLQQKLLLHSFLVVRPIDHIPII